MGLSCDIFCTVVDNLGDAGVCWRLARQLAVEKGWAVRLWIDDPLPLALLRPGIDSAAACQSADGVEIHRWSADFPETAPGQVVIEAFACELPPAYIAAMAASAKPPVWLNLEYLSAEDWVAGCHGLASPHPSLPLTKHFFFPGFGHGTGGLIREAALPWPSPHRPGAGELLVSLFCYDDPTLPRLLDAWASGDEPIRCHVADGLPRRQVERWLESDFPVGAVGVRGALTLEALPFLPQPEYDRLLADCHLNFVRGEDSFIRAQWACHPFVWHIYPQVDEAHVTKLEAFLGRYCAGLSEQAAVHGFWRAWNGIGDVAAAWPAFRAALPALAAHAAPWARELTAPGDLATNLEKFCIERI